MIKTRIPHRVTLRVKGALDPNWRDYFGQLEMHTENTYGPHATTVFSGSIPDQAALLGLLNSIHSLNITLMSVEYGVTVE